MARKITPPQIFPYTKLTIPTTAGMAIWTCMVKRTYKGNITVVQFAWKICCLFPSIKVVRMRGTKIFESLLYCWHKQIIWHTPRQKDKRKASICAYNSKTDIMLSLTKASRANKRCLELWILELNHSESASKQIHTYALFFIIGDRAYSMELRKTLTNILYNWNTLVYAYKGLSVPGKLTMNWGTCLKRRI